MSETRYSHVTRAPGQLVNNGAGAGSGFWFVITTPVYFTATAVGKEREARLIVKLQRLNPFVSSQVHYLISSNLDLSHTVTVPGT